MWKRQVKTAKWNGVAFNIQQTTLDNGKRLHVVEMPYEDEPYIKVMGAKAKGINLEAVFVGVNSLADANAFVAELESDPIGSLEHPYLGEMSLVYQTSSQSFSTKLGLVTLSLKYLKQGKEVVLTRTREPVSKLSDSLIEASTAQFVRDIEQALPEEISSLQADFTRLLNVVKSVASRITQLSIKLTSLHHQIQDGINAVNTILTAPGAFADHLNAVIKSLVNVVADDSASSPGIGDTSRSLRQAIGSVSVSAHCNIQILVAIVLLSEELALVGEDDAAELGTFAGRSIDKVAATIDALSTLIDDRLNEVTQSADYESLALVEAIHALRESVTQRRNKIETLLFSIRRVELNSNQPLLCIAQSQECTATDISTLNVIAHPLFVCGSLRIPNE